MKYIAIIHKDLTSDFGVSFPDFPGCISVGSTYEEAKTLSKEALLFHIDGMRKDGEDLPYPSSMVQVMSNDDYSDGAAFYVDVPFEINLQKIRVNLSIPADKLRAIDENARQLGLNRSAYIIEKCS